MAPSKTLSLCVLALTGLATGQDPPGPPNMPPNMPNVPDMPIPNVPDAPVDPKVTCEDLLSQEEEPKAETFCSSCTEDSCKSLPAIQDQTAEQAQESCNLARSAMGCSNGTAPVPNVPPPAPVDPMEPVPEEPVEPVDPVPTDTPSEPLPIPNMPDVPVDPIEPVPEEPDHPDPIEPVPEDPVDPDDPLPVPNVPDVPEPSGPSPAPLPVPNMPPSAPDDPTPAPAPAPSPSQSCNVGDDVDCSGGGRCAGNQCCGDGSICPSADSSFQECPGPKSHDCTTASIMV